MVRKRLTQSTQANEGSEKPASSSNKTKFKADNQRKILFFLLLITSTIFVAFRYYMFLNLQRTADAVTKLADLPLASLPYDQLEWGSYRPHLYFGLRNRHPNSPLFGLVWFKQPKHRYIQSLPLRHWCDHGDGTRFMWEDCDGKTFGHQTIQEDDGINFETDWFNHKGSRVNGAHSWSARVNLLKSASESVAFVFYFALQDTVTRLDVFRRWRPEQADTYDILRGTSPIFGDFSLSIRTKSRDTLKLSYAIHQMSPTVDAIKINNIVMSSLRWESEEDENDLCLMNEDTSNGLANFVAIQVTVKKPTQIEINYGDRPTAMPSFDEVFQKRVKEFRHKFSELFPIDELNMQKLGRTALSNLLGGIGYWHGHAVVQSSAFDGERPYGPLSLLSAVPSRPFFPRGFIWDEGFHNILIAKFDSTLSLQIISSWLDTMNDAGWIPREMILGAEAVAKVPSEFLVQSDAVANPPVFFFLIEKFLKDREFVIKHGAVLRRLYPRLKKWYIWLRTTQSGPRPGTFRWRGRNSTTKLELNPKTLPSGLDDFPRASHPNDKEYHLDLRCWMAIASRVLRMLSEQSDDIAFTTVVEEDMNILNDAALLDRLHWSDRVQRYADYGYHSTSVRLVKKRRRLPGEPPQFVEEWSRDIVKAPTMTLVEDANGYVSLFPFLLKLVSTDSPKLEIILKNLDDPNELWSPYGLRSLSKLSPYYKKRNTEHDPPYWRGAIWININYLALDALQHYAHESNGAPAAVRTRAHELHKKLRLNVVNLIAAEFDRTGFFWENYNDETGHGQGTRPFTGWTALILNVLASQPSL